MSFLTRAGEVEDHGDVLDVSDGEQGTHDGDGQGLEDGVQVVNVARKTRFLTLILTCEKM